MFQMIGIVLLVWLVIGFISGLKIIYFDKEIESMVEDIESGDVGLTKDEQVAYEMLGNNRHLYLIVLTLMGLYSFYIDTKYTFMK